MHCIVVVGAKKIVFPLIQRMHPFAARTAVSQPVVPNEPEASKVSEEAADQLPSYTMALEIERASSRNVSPGVARREGAAATWG